MAWIKKHKDVVVAEEMEFASNSISKTDAYEVEITDCYLKESANEESKSVSLVVGAKTKDDETVRTYFTVLGRDGETYFVSEQNGKKVKKQHFGLSIANTMFGIALQKEIFDVDPETVTYQEFDKDSKSMVDAEGDGFPDVVGCKIGVCVQMIREIDGANSKEYPQIVHFFDVETGLLYNEEASDNTKLDKWLKNAKEYKEIKKEAPKSAFKRESKNSDDSEEKPVRRGWGRK